MRVPPLQLTAVWPLVGTHPNANALGRQIGPHLRRGTQLGELGKDERDDRPNLFVWIEGNAAVQQIHRVGTELRHAARPTELSIPALSTVETTVTFPTAGSEYYICHLPGHEAYGMVGVLDIR